MISINLWRQQCSRTSLIRTHLIGSFSKSQTNHPCHACIFTRPLERFLYYLKSCLWKLRKTPLLKSSFAEVAKRHLPINVIQFDFWRRNETRYQTARNLCSVIFAFYFTEIFTQILRLTARLLQFCGVCHARYKQSSELVVPWTSK